MKGPDITEYLTAALKAGALRQAITADNIANLNTPGYRRKALAFEQRLAEAIAAGRRVELSDLQKDIIQPMDTVVNAHGNDVNLEMEIGEMVKVGVKYKVYLRLLAKLYRQMELAMQGQ